MMIIRSICNHMLIVEFYSIFRLFSMILSSNIKIHYIPFHLFRSSFRFTKHKWCPLVYPSMFVSLPGSHTNKRLCQLHIVSGKRGHRVHNSECMNRTELWYANDRMGYDMNKQPNNALTIYWTTINTHSLFSFMFLQITFTEFTIPWWLSDLGSIRSSTITEFAFWKTLQRGIITIFSTTDIQFERGVFFLILFLLLQLTFGLSYSNGSSLISSKANTSTTLSRDNADGDGCYNQHQNHNFRIHFQWVVSFRTITQFSDDDQRWCCLFASFTMTVNRIEQMLAFIHHDHHPLNSNLSFNLTWN